MEMLVLRNLSITFHGELAFTQYTVTIFHYCANIEVYHMQLDFFFDFQILFHPKKMSIFCTCYGCELSWFFQKQLQSVLTETQYKRATLVFIRKQFTTRYCNLEFEDMLPYVMRKTCWRNIIFNITRSAIYHA